MVTVESAWAFLAGALPSLALGYIWGGWPDRLLSDLRTAKAAAKEAREREAITQARNLQLMRQLEAARQANAARLVDPGDHTQ